MQLDEQFDVGVFEEAGGMQTRGTLCSASPQLSRPMGLELTISSQMKVWRETILSDGPYVTCEAMLLRIHRGNVWV